jgi:hypothetical protein
VEVADDGGEADDLLAVEIDDEPEDAVRRRVVGPEVDLEDVALLADVVGDLEDGRDRRGDARPLVDPRLLDDRQRYSSPENRTGSPPIG